MTTLPDIPANRPSRAHFRPPQARLPSIPTLSTAQTHAAAFPRAGQTTEKLPVYRRESVHFARTGCTGSKTAMAAPLFSENASRARHANKSPPCSRRLLFRASAILRAHQKKQLVPPRSLSIFPLILRLP